MKMRRNQLAATVKYVLMAGLASATAMPGGAHAQTPAREESATLETITVTGTRIRRVDMETASPVFVIDQQAIERTGAATIGDFLQDIPAISGAATNPSVNNGGGDGAATVSLRGLGDSRTLTLLNGRRMVYNDINSIPMAAIARVEVLKGGASAIYGSDAIGGVVNFILKNEFEGGELTAGYGQSSKNDGERVTGNVLYGWSGERGSVLLNLNYNDQQEVRAADRDYSRDALTLYSGSVTVGGSSRTTTGRYAVPRAAAAANGINCPGSGATVALTRIEGRPGRTWSDFRCFNAATDLFNYQAVGNLQLTPQERAGLFFAGRFDLTDSATAYTEIVTQSTRSYGQIAPLPFDARPGLDDVPISPQSVFWPFTGLTTGLVNNDLRLRLSAIGNRRFSYNTDVQQISTGIEGMIGESSWTYDAGITYGKLEQESTATGYLFTPALAAALGPSFRDASGTLRCGTPGNVIPNCTPVNFFGDLSSPDDQAALARISSPSTNTSDATLKNFYANFSGDLFTMPAGPVATAFGVEYREESSAFVPSFLALVDPTNYTCLISSEACTTAAIGEFDVTEVYGEALFPIVSSAPFAESLSATLGVRWSDYSSFGSTTNTKIGIEWRPISELLVRGTVDEVFRAPTVADLFQGDSASSDSFSDPCNRWRGAPPGSPQRLACQNVPTDGSFIQTDTQLSAIKGGNPNLRPETGKVFTYGLIYDPEWLAGSSFSLDVWRVYLNDTIGTIGGRRSSTTASTTASSAICSRACRPGRSSACSIATPTSAGPIRTASMSASATVSTRPTGAASASRSMPPTPPGSTSRRSCSVRSWHSSSWPAPSCPRPTAVSAITAGSAASARSDGRTATGTRSGSRATSAGSASARSIRIRAPTPARTWAWRSCRAARRAAASTVARRPTTTSRSGTSSGPGIRDCNWASTTPSTSCRRSSIRTIR